MVKYYISRLHCMYAKKYRFLRCQKYPLVLVYYFYYEYSPKSWSFSTFGNSLSYTYLFFSFSLSITSLIVSSDSFLRCSNNNFTLSVLFFLFSMSAFTGLKIWPTSVSRTKHPGSSSSNKKLSHRSKQVLYLVSDSFFGRKAVDLKPQNKDFCRDEE